MQWRPVWRDHWFGSISFSQRICAICQLCTDKVPRGGRSTKSYTPTNLVHHLKTKHCQEYAEYEKKKSEKQPEAPQASSPNEAGPLQQISLMEVVKLHKQWDINDASTKAIHQQVRKIIAVDCQLISVVESSGFKVLIHARLLPNTAFLVGRNLLRRWYCSRNTSWSSS